MPKHMFREIEKLKKRILHLGAIVEKNLAAAVRAMETRDETLAREVIESDDEIDAMEVEIEEDALKILALYQPVAKVLRFVIAMIKINNGLERIGDLAANISKRAVFLVTTEPVGIPFDFSAMAERAANMLKTSIDALINSDSKLAGSVCGADEKVDEINRQAYSLVMDAIAADPEHIENYLQLNAVARGIERIADHATNIAEDVIYMVEGEIVRHQTDCRLDADLT